MSLAGSRFNEGKMRLVDKLAQVNWLFVAGVLLTAGIGFGMLYSAAGGNIDPWASRQMVRFGIGLGVMFAIAFVDIRFWMRWAYAFYFASLLLLGIVEVMGVTGMGAQRWLSFGPTQIQPSEIMKIALILGLARYFHGRTLEEVTRPIYLILPLAMVLVPAALVLRQPDLGTGVILILAATTVIFIAGVKLWKFGILFGLALGAVPVAWHMLRDYQRARILTFLDPERDPLGAGYHILQSKIALGSGGVFGKGFMQGTQSHLNFLPERQTDFIFTMLAEEFGLVGGLGLILLYMTLVALGFLTAVRSASQFGRYLALGIITIFFLYVFINIAMVMGILPVVGVPLPLISYGGSSMMTLLAGFGFLLNVAVHRDVQISRRGVVPG
ncbi:MAG: rod shape-determining protein RodA [Alphaproteobacteria bacterium]